MNTAGINLRSSKRATVGTGREGTCPPPPSGKGRAGLLHPTAKVSEEVNRKWPPMRNTVRKNILHTVLFVTSFSVNYNKTEKITIKIYEIEYDMSCIAHKYKKNFLKPKILTLCFISFLKLKKLVFWKEFSMLSCSQRLKRYNTTTAQTLLLLVIIIVIVIILLFFIILRLSIYICCDTVLCLRSIIDTFPRSFPVDGEVAILLRICYVETGVMGFVLYPADTVSKLADRQGERELSYNETPQRTVSDDTARHLAMMNYVTITVDTTVDTPLC